MRMSVRVRVRVRVRVWVRMRVRVRVRASDPRSQRPPLRTTIGPWANVYRRVLEEGGGRRTVHGQRWLCDERAGSALERKHQQERVLLNLTGLLLDIALNTWEGGDRPEVRAEVVVPLRVLHEVQLPVEAFRV